jgi:hypothetical protein
MINKPTLGVAALVVVAALGGWYFLHTRAARTPQAVAAAPQTAAPALAVDSADAPIQHPLPEAPAAIAAAPLPALADSDEAIGGALGEVLGVGVVKEYLRPDAIIRHIVVTVDNLARDKAAVDKRPTNTVAGTFLAEGDELHAILDARNFARYQPWVTLIGALDVARLVRVYVRFYPLFQHAYQDLGYPSGYFNDRLVQVIDVLLAAPRVAGPIDLVRPNVLYEFADPELQARPAGQKLLLRMGPENAAVIRAKLSELRAAVTAASLKH